VVVAFVRGFCGTVALVVACGGISQGTSDEERELADAGQDSEDPCVCPAQLPARGDTCDCPELRCSFTPQAFGCWRGEVVCNEDTWQRVDPQNDVPCPSSPFEIDSGLCSGEGSCEYEIDLGCGPDVIVFSCECIDYSWYLSRASRPTLCDCAAASTRRLCGLYSGDCTWSSERELCEPRE
jgi:hypothetical protein